jgi:2'-5' RNA ligase
VGIPLTAAAAAVARTAAATSPFTFVARGYGLFAEHPPGGATIHVPVVRGGGIEELHESLCRALMELGATLATWTDSLHWSPHVTLLDAALAPAEVALAVRWLVERRHPSWHVPVRSVVLAGARVDGGGVLPFDLAPDHTTSTAAPLTRSAARSAKAWSASASG